MLTTQQRIAIEPKCFIVVVLSGKVQFMGNSLRIKNAIVGRFVLRLTPVDVFAES